jgi:hypothetical protein
MEGKMSEKLTYVHMKGDRSRTYRVVDDKTVDGVHRLVLLIVDGPDGVGYYTEASPESLEPVDRDPYRIGSVSPAD